MRWFGEIAAFDAGADEFLAALGDTPKVRLVMRDCPGGSSTDALRIAEAFTGRDVEVFVAGVCASAAVLGLVGARRVTCSPGARFMLHAVQDAVFGPAALLRGRAAMLDRITGRVCDLLSKRLTVGPEQIHAWLTDGADHWFTAREALALGLVDEVVEDAAFAPQSVEDVPSTGAGNDEDGSDETLALDLLRALGRVDVCNKARFLRELHVWSTFNVHELPRSACAVPGAAALMPSAGDAASEPSLSTSV